jgi:hypothetical protein
VKVIFEHIIDGWTREADMPAIPRVGEDVAIDDEELQVKAVIWLPFDAPESHAVVRLQ